MKKRQSQCSKCGSKRAYVEQDNFNGYFVKCKSCGKESLHFICCEQAAINNWNDPSQIMYMG